MPFPPTRRLRSLAAALLLAGLAACAGAPATKPAPADALAAADTLLEAGLPDAALAQLERALQHGPDDPDLSIRIGEIELERGNPTDAYFAFKRAAGLAPDEIRAVSGLALAADALGFDDEAAAAYRRWAELEDAAPGAGPSGAAGDRGSDPW